jgi:hypothetical protein
MALPQFFTMNGYNFEKITINDTVIVCLQYTYVGIVSENRIYFDTNFTHMLGDFSMELWSDTLNYATSTDPTIDSDFNDQRKNLQEFLTERRAQEIQAILASIDYTVFDMYDSGEDDDLTDYDDFYDTEDEYDEGHFVGNEIPVY